MRQLLRHQCLPCPSKKMASELESVHREVNAALYNLETPQLVELGKELEIEGIEDGLSRLRLVKRISRHLDRDEVDQYPDGGLAMLRTVREAISLASPTQSSPEPSMPGEKDTPNPATVPAQIPSMTLRREFNITGHIGEPGQRDKLSFSSLIHQLQIGLDKKYPEKEIVAAVIRSIVPGTKLRSYLEG